MLVKVWNWPGRVNRGFPYQARAVIDQLGTPGQGDENPPPFFWDHAIARAGRGRPELSSALYDPSYGTGPWPSEAELQEIREGRKPQPTIGEVMQKYQDASISGYCQPAGNGIQELPRRCQVSLVGSTVQLGAIRWNGLNFEPTAIRWP